MSRVVAIAMSGGVDSSVAAALLVDQEPQVFGVMLRLWGDPRLGPNRCCSPDDVSRARRTAHTLGIPFYVLNAQQRFWEVVVEPFVRGYAQGVTPNPCFDCNRSIRFGFLLRHALAMGATHLATGHYARTDFSEGAWHLRRAIDLSKDQSYVLSVLGQEQLAHAVFPLGNRSKQEVRTYARQRGLAAMDRPDSQDLCFLGGTDYRAFLAERVPQARSPGPILDLHGNTIGTHTGLADYTLGQRKGIRIAATAPLYVIEKHLDGNALVVGPRSSVGRSEFRVGNVHWIAGKPPSGTGQLRVQVRYHSPDVPATIETVGPDQALVQAGDRIPEVSPGQGAVFYCRDECLGSGVILP